LLALADSVNPMTIAIAVYLAATPDPRRRLASYTLGIFAVYLAGGVVLVLGPGELLRTVAHGSHSRGFHAVSIGVGAAVVALAAIMFSRRRRLIGRQSAASALRPGSALALGAGVTALDLPTALPYFAAIGAIVSSDAGLPGQLALLAMFNVLYVLPILAVLLVHMVIGERSEPLLARARRLIERLGPAVLVGLTLVAGVVLVVRGAIGLLR
jgi:cytochrome c biogenesis protein CcdA